MIIRDRGFNVATWNICHRKLTKSGDGAILAGDSPLRFYHFTSFDSGDGIGVLMRNAPDQTVAHEIWDEYKNDLIQQGQLKKSSDWVYGIFDNGEIIPKEARRIYRARGDLQEVFPDPFNTALANNGFYGWWVSHNLEKELYAQKTSGLKFLITRMLGWFRSPKTLVADVHLFSLTLEKEGFYVLLKKVVKKLKGF